MSSDSSFPQRGPPTPVFQTTTTHTTYPVVSSSTTAAYGVLVLIIIYYFLQYLEAHHLPLSELLWNSLVYITPSRMLSALGSDFSSSTPQELEDDGFDVPKGFDSQRHASKSNAMRRLLGLNNNRIMTAVQRTRTLSDLGSVFKSKPVNSLPGLGNWDHSCYQNSVIQGLASLENLPRFLRRDDVEGEAGSWEEGATRKALRELTESLNDKGNVGKTFWTPSALKSMSSWQQQDAQEYFSKVMDSLEKDAAKAEKIRDRWMGLQALSTTDDKRKKGSVSRTGGSTPQTIRMSQLPEELQSVTLMNPLEGLLAQRVGCQQCGYVEGLSLVPFNCLTAPLGRQWMYDIRECLDEYTALEPINGVECAKCTLIRARSQMGQMLKQLLGDNNLNVEEDYSTKLASLREDAQKRLKSIQDALDGKDFSDSVLKKCQIPAKNYVLTTKSRQAVVARAPKALVIHLNRSMFDELTGEQSKNQATVRFPKRFGLGSWCLGSKNNDLEEPAIEKWNTDPKQSMLSDNECGGEPNPGPLYELRAVVTHYGRHENGHYICYRRSPYTSEASVEAGNAKRTEPWWRLSDEEVKEVSEETVLAQGGVFMLFYEQVLPMDDALPLAFEQGPEESNLIPSTELDRTAASELADDQQSVLVGPKPEDEIKFNMVNASAYPTPPPEHPDVSFQGDSAMYEHKNSIQDQVSPTKSLAQPGSSNVPINSSGGRSSLSCKKLMPHATFDVTCPPISDSTRLGTPPAEHSVIAPPPMKTISPRAGRGKGRRSDKAMESMAGSVQAN